MLKTQPPDYKYCPFCRGDLATREDDGLRRKHCVLCDWVYYPQVFISVAAVILKNKKTLLVKRNREPYRNTWMFPGGFVEYGEHPLETLKKEILEETGLRMTKSNLLEMVQTVDDPRAPGNLIFFYLVETLSGKVKTDKNENSDIAWFDITKPPKIGWKSHRKIMDLVKSKKYVS